MAFGVDDLDELGERVSQVLEMAPPEGMMDKIRALGRLKSLADSRPKSCRPAPPGDRHGSAQSLDALPIMTCWPRDGGPLSRCRR